MERMKKPLPLSAGNILSNSHPLINSKFLNLLFNYYIMSRYDYNIADFTLILILFLNYGSIQSSFLVDCY